MSSHEKGATPDSRPSDKPADDAAEQPKAKKSFAQKLGVIGHYILLGLGPVIAVSALGVAVFAVTGNKSGEEQISKSIAKIENLNASLAASKSELEKLKITLAQEKIAQEEDRKKQEERFAKLVQNITPLQVKLKFSPTLADQLRQQESASAVPAAAVSSVPAAPAVPAVTAMPADKKLNPQVRDMKNAIDKYNKK